MTGPLRERLLRAWAALTRRQPGDDRLEAELAFHRDMIEADLRRQGLDEPTARRQASQRIGGTARVLESHRDQRTIPAFESVVQDTRYALRTFSRAPGFTLAALLTLALGIGATTAIFSTVNAVLLRPLPLPGGDRLVTFGDRTGTGPVSTMGFQTIAEIRDRNRSFEHLAAVGMAQATLVTTEAERLNGMRVSWDYFSLLGVSPALGRSFQSQEDRPEQNRVVILSDALWRRRFDADPGVIGRTVSMSDVPYQVIGVMAPEFEDLVSTTFYNRADLWVPLRYDASLPQACRTCRHLRAIGRLRPGVTAAQAAEDVSNIHADLVRQFPTAYGDGTIAVTRLEDILSQPVREPLYVLLAAVGFVLLIACANVANLLLARVMNRSREIALRAALGAGRGRIVRQLVTEGVLLWTAGGAVGVALGAAMVRVLLDLAPAGLPRAAQVGIDTTVLAVAAALSLTTGLLFGLLPALSAASARLRSGIGADSRGSVGSGAGPLRHALVVVDLAVALVLLAGAGLMLKSVDRMLEVSPGFTSDRVLTAGFTLAGRAYREDDAVYAFVQQLVDRTRALPGVESAAVAGQVPMGGNFDRYGLYVEGQPTANPADAPSPQRYSVTSDYFRVMQIPVLRGRGITEQDTRASEPIILISETAARTVFAGHNPIGRRVRVGGAPDAPWRTIVGVVGDVRHEKLTETVEPQMYLPQSQFTDSFLVLVLKGSSDRVMDLAPAIRLALREQDPAIALYDVALLDDLLAESFADRRFVMLLLVGFAGVALLLAAIGLYGVVSYSVAERTREVGLRMALGATRKDILRLVFGSAAGTAAAGMAIGLAAAAGLTRFLQGQLFEVRPLDPAALAGAVFVLTVVVAAAHLIPIRRALAVDPSVALRDE